MSTSPAPDSGRRRQPAGRARKIIAGLAAAAAAIVAVFAFTAGPSSVARAATPAVAPDVLVNSFSGENSVPAGVAAWHWITGTVSESFGNTTSRGVITGSVVLGSSNGAAVSGRLGVCYQASGGAITNQNWEIINFTAPTGQWITQTVSGTAVPATAATFAVGLCAYDTSANLTFSTAFGAGAGTVTVAVNSGP